MERDEVFRGTSLIRYRTPPYEHHMALRMVLLQGTRGALFLTSEVPLQRWHRQRGTPVAQDVAEVLRKASQGEARGEGPFEPPFLAEFAPLAASSRREDPCCAGVGASEVPLAVPEKRPHDRHDTRSDTSAADVTWGLVLAIRT